MVEDAVDGAEIEAAKGGSTAVKVTRSEATVVEVIVEDTEIEADEGEATVLEVSEDKAAIETAEGEVTKGEATVVMA